MGIRGAVVTMLIVILFSMLFTHYFSIVVALSILFVFLFVCLPFLLFDSFRLNTYNNTWPRRTTTTAGWRRPREDLRVARARSRARAALRVAR